LFMPGDGRRKIEKGAALDVDAVIMDLEDGVALSNKPAARAVTAAALREVDFGRTERLVRLNPVDSLFFDDDLAETIDAHPDGYVLPKVESAGQVREVAARLLAAEGRNGWRPGGIRLLAIIETGRGVLNLREIAESDSRLDALVFGAEDLAGDIGATRTPEGWEVYYARSAVVIHAKSCGLQAIDTPFVDLADLERLGQETRLVLGMGYTGKLAIHPRQVDIIQRVFTPTPEEIQQAQRLIAAHDAQQAGGAGVFELDGKMVDMPMVRAAQTLLARARAAGIEC
jgi:citrate lyase beta subunit